MLCFTCKATLNLPISLCSHGIVCSGDKASTPLDWILYVKDVVDCISKGSKDEKNHWKDS